MSFQSETSVFQIPQVKCGPDLTFDPKINVTEIREVWVCTVIDLYFCAQITAS